MRHQSGPVQEAGVAVLDRELVRLHQPTSCPTQVLDQMVHMPITVRQLPDSRMLDLALTVNDRLIYANVRVATEAAFDDVVTHVHAQLGGLTISTTPRSAVIEASGLRATVDDYYTFRSVRWQVCDAKSDRAELISRYENWHRGTAPVGTASPCGVSIETFSDGPRAANIALYTTHYEFCEPIETVRSRIDRELTQAGWSVAEPRENSLFLRGPFDAEVHLSADPCTDTTTVDFVGEFDLS